VTLLNVHNCSLNYHKPSTHGSGVAVADTKKTGLRFASSTGENGGTNVYLLKEPAGKGD
jgi:hypothetical protein